MSPNSPKPPLVRGKRAIAWNASTFAARSSRLCVVSGEIRRVVAGVARRALYLPSTASKVSWGALSSLVQINCVGCLAGPVLKTFLAGGVSLASEVWRTDSMND